MKWLNISFLSIIFFTPIVISSCYNWDTVRFWRSKRILAFTCTGTYLERFFSCWRGFLCKRFLHDNQRNDEKSVGEINDQFSI